MKGRVVETQYTAGRKGFRARGPNIARQMDLSQVKIPYNPPVSPDSPNYKPTLSGYHDPNENPSYKFGFRTATYSKQETSDALGHVEGVYSFVDDLGERHDVRYKAGSGTGFNVETAFPDSKPYTGLFYSGPPGKAGGKPRGRSSIQQRLDGSYQFVANAPDHRRTEVSDRNGNVRGSYTYVDDKGQQRTIEYIAGPKIGYKVIKKGVGPGFPPGPPFSPSTSFFAPFSPNFEGVDNNDFPTGSSTGRPKPGGSPAASNSNLFSGGSSPSFETAGSPGGGSFGSGSPGSTFGGGSSSSSSLGGGSFGSGSPGSSFGSGSPGSSFGSGSPGSSFGSGSPGSSLGGSNFGGGSPGGSFGAPASSSSSLGGGSFGSGSPGAGSFGSGSPGSSLGGDSFGAGSPGSTFGGGGSTSSLGGGSFSPGSSGNSFGSGSPGSSLGGGGSFGGGSSTTRPPFGGSGSQSGGNFGESGVRPGSDSSYLRPTGPTPSGNKGPGSSGGKPGSQIFPTGSDSGDIFGNEVTGTTPSQPTSTSGGFGNNDLFSEGTPLPQLIPFVTTPTSTFRPPSTTTSSSGYPVSGSDFFSPGEGKPTGPGSKEPPFSGYPSGKPSNGGISLIPGDLPNNCCRPRPSSTSISLSTTTRSAQNYDDIYLQSPSFTNDSPVPAPPPFRPTAPPSSNYPKPHRPYSEFAITYDESNTGKTTFRERYSKDDDEYMNSDKTYYRVPGPIRAHVQSLDLPTFGSRIPNPGDVLERRVSRGKHS